MSRRSNSPLSLVFLLALDLGTPLVMAQATTPPVVADSPMLIENTGGAVKAPSLSNAPDAFRWDKLLSRTYWYVPTDALPAQFYNGTVTLPMEQQTVYYIESSHRGVYKGWIVTQFTSQFAGLDLPIICQDMYGTIAPRGEISLTLVDTSTGEVVQPWPVSYMTKVNGVWLNMVLASTIVGEGSQFITHGPTYMTPITPRSRYWQDLPGSPGSVPDMVSKCGHSVGVGK